ncbi:MAG: hypothetical protein QXO21_04585 [Candidatus Anstonellales archaeon]
MRFKELYRDKCIKFGIQELSRKYIRKKSYLLETEKNVPKNFKIKQLLKGYSKIIDSFVPYDRRKVYLNGKQYDLNINDLRDESKISKLLAEIKVFDFNMKEMYHYLKKNFSGREFDQLDSFSLSKLIKKTSESINVDLYFLLTNKLLKENEIVFILQQYLLRQNIDFYFFKRAKIEEFCLDEDNENAKDIYDFVSFVESITYFLIYFEKNKFYLFSEGDVKDILSIHEGEFCKNNLSIPILIFDLNNLNNRLSVYSAVSNTFLSEEYKLYWQKKQSF